MPASLHRRAAAMASSRASPATKRRAMRRVVVLEVTQVPNFLFAESFRSTDRNMRVNYRRLSRMTLVFVLFQELFSVDRGHASRTSRGDRLAIAVVLHVTGDEHPGNGSQAAVLGDQVAV